MKYKVCGTITYNWEKTLDADSDLQAEVDGAGYAEDGMVEITGIVDTPEVESVDLVLDLPAP